jgi:CHAD domain-containing protein
MKLIYDLNNSFRDEFFRLIEGEMKEARNYLNDPDENINEIIHEVRKIFKKIRSILRLYRASIGYSVYYRENVFFRDLGRVLSDARDKQVLLENASKISDTLPVDLKNEKITSLLDSLRKKRDDSLSEITQNEKLRFIEKQLANHTLPEDLNFDGEGFELIEKGIKRIYKQARNYLKEIKKQQEDTLIHDFRKRVKYLRYQMSILRPVYPEMIKAYRKALKKISDDTGDHRDYSIFLGHMEENDFYNLNTRQKQFIRDFIQTKNEKLLREALASSDKFFMEKPSDFIASMKKYNKIDNKYQVRQK